FLSSSPAHHRYLRSFPTRRSSDLMAPVCWLIGIPWSQAPTAGALMGIKTVLNELIAYLEMSKLPADALDPRSRLIMLYAMCGFADRKSTRLNSSHVSISYAVFCLK